MKFFVTGGSGFVGSRVVEELISNGHKVSGLARSPEAAAKITALGATAVRGDLRDIKTIVGAAKEADGTLHLGYIHDFANIEMCVAVDLSVISKVCEAYVGTDKVFVYTSATMILQREGPTNEDTQPLPFDFVFSYRRLSEKLALSYSGAKVVVIRLPIVHDVGSAGFIAGLTNLSKGLGTVYYEGRGENRFSSIHRADAAKLYRLAAEKVPGGSILHAVAETVSAKDIAAAISSKYGLKLESTDDPIAKAGPFLGTILAMNNNCSSEKTRKLTGWEPSQISLLVSLLEDIRENY